MGQRSYSQDACKVFPRFKLGVLASTSHALNPLPFPMLWLLSAALFELLAAAAWAGIISPHLRAGPFGCCLVQLLGGLAHHIAGLA